MGTKSPDPIDEEADRKEMKHAPWAKYSAEFIGTFFLVMTVACIAPPQYLANHAGATAGIAIGSMLMVMVYSLASVSGAHLNPAVTLGVVLCKTWQKQREDRYQRPFPHKLSHLDLSAVDVACYIGAQLLGGLFAALIVWGFTGHAGGMAPIGSHTLANAFVTEAFFTMALVYVVLNTACSEDDGGPYAGLAIGFTVVAASFAAGGISGCCLNPAVSVGILCTSAITQGAAIMQHIWIYTIGPLVGGLLGHLGFFLVRGFMQYEEEDVEQPPAPAPQPVVMKVEEPKKRDVPAPPSNKRRMTQTIPLTDVLGRRGTRCVTLAHGHDALIDPELYNTDLWVGLGWHLKDDQQEADFDTSLVKMGKNGRECGAVYFNPDCLHDDANNIHHTGDDVTGLSGVKGVQDNEAIIFRLADVKDEVEYMFFVATIFEPTDASWDCVSKSWIHLVKGTVEWEQWKPGMDWAPHDEADPDNPPKRAHLKPAAEDADLANFAIAKANNEESGNAMIFSCIYRDPKNRKHWRKWAVGEGYKVEGGWTTYRGAVPHLSSLIKRKQEQPA